MKYPHKPTSSRSAAIAVGIIVREAGNSAFHFHAALNEFQFLDGKMFATPQAAQAAADAHGAKRRVAVSHIKSGARYERADQLFRAVAGLAAA